eukprot:2096012-Amphidinium_carterae.1
MSMPTTKGRVEIGAKSRLSPLQVNVIQSLRRPKALASSSSTVSRVQCAECPVCPLTGGWAGQLVAGMRVELMRGCNDCLRCASGWSARALSGHWYGVRRSRPCRPSGYAQHS